MTYVDTSGKEGWKIVSKIVVKTVENQWKTVVKKGSKIGAKIPKMTIF